ncbi:MAG: methyltransferase domain-containing protein [Patescibacteria group bacterium]|jgi:SAM-dependent methyltransferase
MMYLEVAVYIVLLLILLVVLVFVLMWEWSLLFTHAPFIPIPKEVVPSIFDALELRPDSVVYDLGCGEGRVLLGCWEKMQQAKYVGIEKSRFAYWLACINGRRQKASVQFKKKNFFRTDLSDATHVFTYLFPGLMDMLLPKLQKDLKPGTKLVSCDFRFKNKEPIQVIDLKRAPKELGQKLYVYEF